MKTILLINILICNVIFALPWDHPYIEHSYFELSADGKYIYAIEKSSNIIKIDAKTGILKKRYSTGKKFREFVDYKARPYFNRNWLFENDKRSILIVDDSKGGIDLYDKNSLEYLNSIESSDNIWNIFLASGLYNDDEFRRLFILNDNLILDKINLNDSSSEKNTILLSPDLSCLAVSDNVNYAITVNPDYEYNLVNLNTFELSKIVVANEELVHYVDNRARFIITETSIIRLSDYKVLYQYNSEYLTNRRGVETLTNLFFIDNNNYIINDKLITYNYDTDSISSQSLNGWQPTIGEIFSPIKRHNNMLYHAFGNYDQHQCYFPDSPIGPCSIKAYNIDKNNYDFGHPDILTGKVKKMKFSPNGDLGIRQGELLVLQDLDTKEIINNFDHADDFCFPKNNEIIFFRSDSVFSYEVNSGIEKFLFEQSVIWKDNIFYEDNVYFYNSDIVLKLNLDENKIDTLFTPDSTLHAMRALHGKLEMYFQSGVYLYDLTTKNIETVIIEDPPAGYCNSISPDKNNLIFVSNIYRYIDLYELGFPQIYSRKDKTVKEMKKMHRDVFFLSDNVIYSEAFNHSFLGLSFLSFPEEEHICSGFNVLINTGEGFYFEEVEILYDGVYPSKLFGYNCDGSRYVDVCEDIIDLLGVEQTVSASDQIIEGGYLKFPKPTSFTIYDLLGTKIYEEKKLVNSVSLSSFYYLKGLYLVRYGSNTAKIFLN